MFNKKRQIDPDVRRALDSIGEDVVRAKLSWIMNVTSLRSAATASHHEGGEQLGDNLTAPLWVIQQWLAEKDARRQGWVKAAAMLAGLAVVVAFLAWFFPITNQAPELVSTAGMIARVTTRPIATLQWNNIGSKPARSGTVTIFTFSGGKRQVKLGKGNIIGAGSNVIPAYTGQAQIDFDKQQLGENLLACVIYLGDDNKGYTQAFLYDQEPVQNDGLRLSELAPPRYNAVCP
jgi:hypothetical protein